MALVAVFLILTLTLTLGASRSAAQPGFQSINCGGEAYKDPITMLNWDADLIESNFHGKVSQLNSSFRNISNVMKTLRYFPKDWRNKKFCYSLPGVSFGSTYLLRASFLYGNYDGLNQPPSFVLILNHDVWANITTSSKPTPIKYELTFVSKHYDLNICLAPNFNSNHTPFISTLELRPLNSTMYNNNSSDALSRGYGLMVWRRINYGTITDVETRYPDDPFDRIWEANTSGPSVSTSLNKVGVYDAKDPEQPPAKVMATAITSNNSKGNISFTYDGFGGPGGVRIQMHFQEVDQTLASGQSPRFFGITFYPYTISMDAVPDGPTNANLDDQTVLQSPLQITMFPVAGSPRGPLLNAIELFRWTQLPLSTIVTFRDDANAIEKIQTHFKLTGYGQGDPCMPKGYSWIWIKCNDDNQPRITQINLASFNLTGNIPSSINNLPLLRTIDFSNNMLSGQIPDFNNLTNLEYLDLHHNNLTGDLPRSLLSLPKLAKLDISYNNLCGISLPFEPSTNYTDIGNSGQCNGSSSSSDSLMLPTLAKTKNNTRKYIFAISFMGALCVVSMLLLLIGFYKVRHSGAKEETSRSAIAANKKGVDDFKGLTFMSKMFTYDEIKNATLNFTTILGEGGFGKVYHGLLPTGEAIAVKMLADASKQGLKEFYNEVAILSRVRHKNVVSLIGYCVENTYMLIYEYIAKGNLRDLIYGDVESTDKPLPWTTRLHIALDASQGLDYLHMGCDPTIIHRDVKSSNILLSDKMQAKVADFGLSRLKEGDNANSHVSTINVVGTAGYLDPAYNSTNQLTDRSDVYSFGIVLFELICGRAPIDMFNSPPHIVDWALQGIKQGKIGDIVDPMLAKGYKVESMWKVIDVAIGCVESDRVKRPKMSQVFQLLQNALENEMDENLPSNSQDVSGSSSTSERKLPILQHLKSTLDKLEPR